MTSATVLHRYARARSLDDALALLADDPRAAAIAGGTDLVPLTRARLREVSCVVDLGGLPFTDIRLEGRDTLVLGALATMADAARHPLVRAHAPLLVMALEVGASVQVRHRATLGGNLLQAPRCPWLRSGAPGCNRRIPGSGCDAQAADSRDGERWLAILGSNAACAAAATSDFAVALHALDAALDVASTQGTRAVPIAALWSDGAAQGSPPGMSTLARGELITAVRVPTQASQASHRFVFEKVRDRASFEFAVVSVAVMLRVEGGLVRAARVSAGGVAPWPWRLAEVEAALIDRPASAASLVAASARAAEGARPFAGNAFKAKLLCRTVRRALQSATETA
jgi:xanthine dehydrogenase YagS FAD-binding subunit